ncbi:MAG: hypothetical protein DMG81_05380, partial [Acidobacteria bacterium]
MKSIHEDLAQTQGLPALMEPNILKESADFSLVLGGPIFQLLRRSHLAGDGLELVHRRLLT